MRLTRLSKWVSCKCTSYCTKKARRLGSGYAKGHNPRSHSFKHTVTYKLRLAARNRRLAKTQGVTLAKKFVTDSKFAEKQILVARNKDIDIRQKHAATLRRTYADGSRSVSPRVFVKVVSTKAKMLILCKSTWEAEFVKVIEKLPCVVSMQYEPIGIRYKVAGVPSTYFPDFLLTLTSGVRVLVEVKGYELASAPARVKAKLRAAIKYCKKAKFQWLFLTSLSEVKTCGERIIML